MTGLCSGYTGKQSADLSVEVGGAFAIAAVLTFLFIPDLGNALLSRHIIFDEASKSKKRILRFFEITLNTHD